MSADFLREHIFFKNVDIPFKWLFKPVLFAAMLTSVDETLKSINASTFGMKKYEKAHAHSDPLSQKTWPCIQSFKS